MKEMNDDPRLTAYALGELEGAEQQAVEEQLRSDPEARRFVEELSGLGQSMSQELAEEEGPGLLDWQRQLIEDRLLPLPVRLRKYPARFEQFVRWGGLALAAGIILFFGILPLSRHSSRVSPPDNRTASQPAEPSVPIVIVPGMLDLEDGSLRARRDPDLLAAAEPAGLAKHVIALLRPKLPDAPVAPFGVHGPAQPPSILRRARCARTRL